MTKAAPHITILGSVNLDFIIQTQTLPTAGETIGNGTFTALPGGKGANVAMMARRLGADVTLLACVGDDPQAGPALAMLKEADVDLSKVQRLADAPTGIAFINVSDDGENQIAVASGANMAFSPERLDAPSGDAIISQFEIPEETILAAAKNTEAFFALNPSPVGPDLAPFLDHVELIIVNQGEYAHYEKSLAGFVGLIAVTKGGDGAELIKAGELIASAQPPEVDIVDTTGAGDSFAAALTVAMIEGQEPQAALEFACAAGALTATRLGTQAAAPNRSEVEAILNR